MRKKYSENSGTGRSVYVLEYSSTFDRWLLWTLGGVLVDDFPQCSKTYAIRAAAGRLQRFATLYGEPSELRIRDKKSGRFGPARTYPRSSDPKRSRG